MDKLSLPVIDKDMVTPTNSIFTFGSPTPGSKDKCQPNQIQTSSPDSNQSNMLDSITPPSTPVRIAGSTDSSDHQPGVSIEALPNDKRSRCWMCLERCCFRILFF